MKRWLKRGALSLLLVLFVPLLFVGASFVGAIIPGKHHSEIDRVESRDADKTIILMVSLLHADFALPVDDTLRERLSFLSDTGFPLNHPELKYVAVGWGSRAFYTTAGTYSDIKASTVFKAVTGDDAVMRFVAFGEVAGLPKTLRLKLTGAQYERLLTQILADLKRPKGNPVWMRGASIGPNDAFFEAKGRFNIFNPCNQWANHILRKASIQLGVWTPTAQAFRLSLTTYSGAIAE